MAIKKIKVTNFKSFKDLEVELGNFNVVIGANASGKSNFVQIFKFLKDIASSDSMENPISLQGDIEYLRNINIGPFEATSLSIELDREFKLPLFGKMMKRGIKELPGIIKTSKTTYEFALKFKKKGSGYKIAKDSITQKGDFVSLEKTEEEKIGEGEIIYSRSNGKVKVDTHKTEELSIKKTDILPSVFLRERKLAPNTLLLQVPLIFPSSPVRNELSNISIYNFDPKLPKKATPITGKAELEEDGSNLSIILKNIIEDKEKRRKLFNLVQDLLPFVKDLNVEKFADKSLLFIKLREIYSAKQYLPASLISEGTINMMALIIALYFEGKPLTVIEEPERNVHPYLISKIVDMMKDASQKTQVIITTQNPEVVKHAGLENILLLSRDEEGFSTVSRPADKEQVKTFLQNDMGIDELYVQNLLEL